MNPNLKNNLYRIDHKLLLIFSIIEQEDVNKETESIIKMLQAQGKSANPILYALLCKKRIDYFENWCKDYHFEE